MKTRNTSKRSSVCAISLENEEPPEKLRRASPGQKVRVQKINVVVKNDVSLLHSDSSGSDVSPKKLRRVSPRQKCNGEKTNSVKDVRILLGPISSGTDGSAGNLRNVSSRQKVKDQKTNAMNNDISVLRSVSPVTVQSLRKLRGVSPRQKCNGEKTNSVKYVRISLHAISPGTDESAGKLRNGSPRRKGKEQKTNAMKSDISVLRSVSPVSDKSPRNLRKVSPMQNCNGEKTNSVKDVRILLHAISPGTDESLGKLRSLSPRQKDKEQKTNAMKNDKSMLCEVSPVTDKSLEKLRRVSARQEGNEENSNSIRNSVISLESDGSLVKVKCEPQRQNGRGEMSKSNDKFVLLSVSSESDELPDKIKSEYLRQKYARQNTKSEKNDWSLLCAVSSETYESPEETNRPSLSLRQKGNGRKTEKFKNDSTSSFDKGYGRSSSEDDADWPRREGAKAAGSAVMLAKKCRSGNAPDESSDSSSDDFLVPTQSLDLNSDFFKIERKELVPDFLVVKDSISPCISILSDSDNSDDFENSKSIEIKLVSSQSGLQNGNSTVKNEHCSAESGSIKDNVSNIQPLQARKGNETLSHVKAEMYDRVQREKSLVIGRKQLHKAIVETSMPDASKLDVSQLLALGEGLDPKAEPKSAGKTKINNFPKKNVDSEEEGISDWEEVGTSTFEGQQLEHTIPKEGIAVTVQVPNMHQKKKKKGFDVAAYIKRRMNRVRRDIQVLMHKAHLLCWIAHGNYVNKILNSDILMGLSLSLIPSKLCYPDKLVDLSYLQKIVQWFSKAVEVQENADYEEQLLVSLLAQFQNKAAKSKRYMVLMFLCVLRSLGINTRLVISLQPLPLKPPLSEISFLTSKNTSSSKGKKVKQKQQRKTHCGRNKDSPSSSDNVIWEKQDVMNKEEVVRHIEAATPQKVKQAGRSNRKESNKNLIVAKRNITSESASVSGRFLRSRKFVKKYIDDCTTDSDEEVVHKEQESVEDRKTVNRTSATSKKNISIGSENTKEKENKLRNSSTTAHSSGSECTAGIKVFKNGPGKSDRRVLSSDSDSEEAPVAYTKNKKKDRCDVWLEVFLESEKKWICVDVCHRQIHCVREISARATQPVHYVLAWQDDGTIRDVTRRYCPKWHNVTRKLRVDEEWWRESLKPFIGQRTALDDQEDEDLYRQLQDRPMPTTLAEYKNHPLYALKRDLLKFQAIYPPDAPTLGFVRGHPVYARECVYTLQSRDRWLREAKVVRLGETPYKIVKARPKWDRMSGKVIKDIPLEIFGPWQVEDYVPPTAVDGKVPRCAYGNVELFKPSMLPGGTVHMQIPGLNRIARKLQIDCAPAITGFGYINGLWGPIYDGFVVCEEYKYVLAEAWQAEEEDADRRYEEKRLKRIYGNWKRLIKGLLIRERLKARYNFGPVKETTKSKTKKAKTFLEPTRIEIVDISD